MLHTPAQRQPRERYPPTENSLGSLEISTDRQLTSSAEAYKPPESKDPCPCIEMHLSTGKLEGSERRARESAYRRKRKIKTHLGFIYIYMYIDTYVWERKNKSKCKDEKISQHWQWTQRASEKDRTSFLLLLWLAILEIERPLKPLFWTRMVQHCRRGITLWKEGQLFDFSLASLSTRHPGILAYPNCIKYRNLFVLGIQQTTRVR